MEGAKSDFVWSVLDIVPILDIHKSSSETLTFMRYQRLSSNITYIGSGCSIHSVCDGIMMIISRE